MKSPRADDTAQREKERERRPPCNFKTSSQQTEERDNAYVEEPERQKVVNLEKVVTPVTPKPEQLKPTPLVESPTLPNGAVPAGATLGVSKRSTKDVLPSWINL